MQCAYSKRLHRKLTYVRRAKASAVLVSHGGRDKKVLGVRNRAGARVPGRDNPVFTWPQVSHENASTTDTTALHATSEARAARLP